MGLGGMETLLKDNDSASSVPSTPVSDDVRYLTGDVKPEDTAMDVDDVPPEPSAAAAVAPPPSPPPPEPANLSCIEHLHKGTDGEHYYQDKLSEVSTSWEVVNIHEYVQLFKAESTLRKAGPYHLAKAPVFSIVMDYVDTLSHVAALPEAAYWFPAGSCSFTKTFAIGLHHLLPRHRNR
jgi:hypothetical protein